MTPTMYTYINQEHAALTKILERYPTQIDAALNDIKLDAQNWLVLATGSSINASRSAKLYMENIANIHVQIEEPFNYTMYETVSRNTDLVLGVSQSGQSTATIDAIEKVSRQRSVSRIAVTSRPDTELPAACDTTLDILTGKERVGYVTMGFNATVLSLMLLALRFAKQSGAIDSAREKAELSEFSNIIGRIPDTIKKSKAFYTQHKQEMLTPRQYTAIGYGATVGTAMEFQTKFVEVVRYPAGGHDLEAFMHGPYLGIHKDDVQFYLVTDAQPTVMEKMAALRNYEARYIDNIFTINLGKNQNNDGHNSLDLGAVDDPFKAPILAVIPIQLFAWLITNDHGVDLGHQIFTDFSEVVHNKTTAQDYV